MRIVLVLRSLHDEEPRQDVDEDPSHPRRQLVRLGGTEVHVQHQHRHRYADMGANVPTYIISLKIQIRSQIQYVQIRSEYKIQYVKRSGRSTPAPSPIC